MTAIEGAGLTTCGEADESRLSAGPRATGATRLMEAAFAALVT